MRSDFSGSQLVRVARCALAAVAAAVWSASAAGAGTVIVPLAADGAAGGLTYETSLAVTNPTGGDLFVSLDFHPGAVDGVRIEQDLEPVVELVGAGETRFFSSLSRGLETLGLLEVTGDDALRVDVRVRVVDRRGRVDVLQLPILTSAELTAGGDTTVITGYYRDDNVHMTLGLVNGGGVDNACEVQFLGSQGEALSVPISLTLPPWVLGYWSDALGAAGVPRAAEARFHMTCEHPFYSYGLFVDETSGSVVRRDPSVGLVSTLVGSDTTSGGDEADEPESPSDFGAAVIETGPGLVRLRIDGVVHAPVRRRGQPTWIYRLDLPGLSTIESISASVVVETSAWGNQRDRPQHHLLQISRDRWGDGGWGFWVRPDREDGLTLRGLLASRGSGRGNEVARDTEVGLPALYEVKAEQSGKAIRVAGLQLVSGVEVPRKGPLFIQLGAKLGPSNDPKVPSWDWVWRDLVVEVRGR